MANSVTSLIDQLLARMGAGKVGRGAIISLSIRVTMIMLAFVQAVLLARLLGPEQYGVFSIVLSASSVIASLGLFGLGELAVREVSRLSFQGNYAALRGFISFAFGTVVFLSIAGGLILFGYSIFSETALSELRWAVLIVPAMAMLLLFRGTAQGLSEIFHAQAPTDLIRPGLMALILAMLFIVDERINANIALGILSVTYLVSFVFAVGFIKRSLNERLRSQSSEYMGLVWTKGALPFLGVTVLATLQTEINTLLLGMLSTAEQAGLYQPLIRITPIMVLAIQAINIPLAPRISELWETGDTKKLETIVAKTTLVSTSAVLITCIAILIFAETILSAFGKAFVLNASALIWLAGAQLINAMCGPVAELLSMTGNQKKTMLNLVPAVLLNTILSIFLLPDYGAYGAAIALAASIICWNLCMLYSVKKILGLNPSLASVLRKHYGK